MIRRIIVGLNGTQFSRAAVDLSLDWARRYRAELIGIAVVDSPRIAAPQAVPIGAGAFKVERDEEVVRNAHGKAEQLLREFEQRCKAADIRCTTRKLEGNPAEILARESQRADLLLLGAKALPAEQVDTPKVIEHVLRIAARPVLCVPAETAAGLDAALIAYDGSAQAAKALQIFQATGLAADRALHLLTVTASGEGKGAELGAEFLRAHGHTAEVHVQSSQGPVANVILAEAKRLLAGLIVMGAYGQPVLKEMFFGSVTKSLLRESPVPLLLYH